MRLLCLLSQHPPPLDPGQYFKVHLNGNQAMQGHSRIEVYISGELVEVLSVKRYKDLPVGMCENDLEDKRRYQLPRVGRVVQCR
jgi:hypothetical protein